MIHTMMRVLFALVTLALGHTAWTASEAKLSGNDRHFITQAGEDGLAEVELGRLAQQNASSLEIKQFGQRMADDHARVNQELAALASKLGVSAPAQPGGKRASDVKKFAKLVGPKFDHEYAEHMVKDHEKAIGFFEKQAKKGDAEELKQFAAKTLPMLQAHLKLARSLTAQKK